MLQEAIGDAFSNVYTQLIVSMFMQLQMETGVRIDEACHIKIADINISERFISLTTTKGGKPRSVAFGVDFAPVLQTYMRMLPANQTYLFEKRSLGHPSGRYTTAAIQKNLRKLREKATQKFNVDLTYITSHMLRHTHLQNLIAGGADISIAQGQAGHESPRTTTNEYILRNPLLRRKMLDKAQAALKEQE